MEVQRKNSNSLDRDRRSVRDDNAEALRDATLAGYGIARLATFLISDDLRAGRLVPILRHVDADGAPIRAVYPSGRHLSPKVRVFIDELLDAWRPEPPWDQP